MEIIIGKKIRKLREIKGYTQDYMANKLQISQRAYSKLERNEQKISFDRLQSISNILEINPIELLQFDEQMVFNHCKQSGKINTINNHTSQEVISSLNDIIKEQQKTIAFLQKQIERLQVQN